MRRCFVGEPLIKSHAIARVKGCSALLPDCGNDFGRC